MRVILSCVAVLCLAIPAAAQEPDAGMVVCEEPTVRRPETVAPSVGARQVSLDAPIRVRYVPEGYFEPGGPGGDPTTLITVQRCPAVGCDLLSCMEDGEFVPGRVQILADELVFIPDEPWQPEQAYSGIARGVDQDLPFQFCTGTTTDTTAPTIGRLGDVTSTELDVRCDAPEGGYRIAATFAPAQDGSGPPGSIEYLLFQTRGPGIDAPVLRDRVRNFGGTEVITMAFVLPPDQATDAICVRVAAVDGVGNFAWSEPSLDDCPNPVQGNFFYGLCSVSAPGAAPHTALWLVAFGAVALAVVLVLRRRR